MIKARKMKNLNEEVFLADVSSICWKQILTGTHDIDVLINNWSKLLSLITDRHAP